MGKMALSLIWFLTGVLDMCLVSNEKQQEKPDKMKMCFIGTAGILAMIAGVLYQLDL